MSIKKYLSEEHLITESGDHSVSLTNFRLRYKSGNSSNSKLTSIFLEHISSIEVKYKSYPFLIGLFLVALVIAGVSFSSSHDQEAGFLSIAAAAIIIVVYLTKRRHVIALRSTGGTAVMFNIKGMKNDSVLEFIQTVEEAMLQRSKLK